MKRNIVTSLVLVLALVACNENESLFSYDESGNLEKESYLFNLEPQNESGWKWIYEYEGSGSVKSIRWEVKYDSPDWQMDSVQEYHYNDGRLVKMEEKSKQQEE